MLPKVSIIVPCYNEQSTIRLLLEALHEQTYPRAEMEVIIADGGSKDGTRQAIAEFQKDCPDLAVRVMNNALRSIPSALNNAIEASQGQLIIRLDAHSKPYPDYVVNCLNAHEEGRGDNIGGVWEIRPGAQNWIAESIAVAAAHPLGVGDALYRHASRAIEVDTVPFGSFRRALIDKIGRFDETLHANEDYEFNVRVRKSGGTVWLDPSIRSTYFARANLGELARQYWRYGYWKWLMLRRYPNTLRWRQAMPPAFVLSLLGLSLLSFFQPLVGWVLIAELLFYFAALFVAGLQVAWRQRKPSVALGLPLAISAMHIAWGSGFLWSILSSRGASVRLRPSEHKLILFFGDLVMGLASVVASSYTWVAYNRYVLINIEGVQPRKVPDVVDVPSWFFLLPIIWTFLLVDLYEPHVAGNGRRTIRGIAVAAFVGFVAYSVIFLISPEPGSLPRVGFGAFLFYASLLTLAWRAIFIRLYKTTGQMRRALLVGAGRAGQTLAQLYNTLSTRSFNLVGFIDDDTSKIGTSIEGIPVISSSAELLRVIDAYRISDLVIAITGAIRGETFQAILEAQERGVDVTRMPIMYEEMMGRVPIHYLESDWIIRSFVDGLQVSGFYLLTKRLLDILGGIAGLLIFILNFPFLALAVLVDTGFPIFYSQNRMGRGGSLFRIYKYRTMYQSSNSDTQPNTTLENDPRITRVGRFLRRTRLDELPQFWNVFRGEMSLVGPRAEQPELVIGFQKQIPFYRARLLVKPGLTGWAQINYGYVASVTETAVKLEYDLYYIKHRTLAMDFQIILRTIGTVFRRTGR
ncbi:MAG TPA: exopolysaccharide biosynthesis polyprenyl glycosylphosphotransferase [Anaerolineales bacterium]